MMSAGLTGTIDAHGECLKGFAAFLEKCDNLSDLQNMALVFRAYENSTKWADGSERRSRMRSWM